MSTECKCSPEQTQTFTYTSVNAKHGIIWAEIREGGPADGGKLIEKQVYLRNKTMTTPSKLSPIRSNGVLFIDVTVKQFHRMVNDARKLGAEIS